MTSPCQETMAHITQPVVDDLCLDSKQVEALDKDCIILVLDEWLFSVLKYGLVPPKGSLRTSSPDLIAPNVYDAKIEAPWKRLFVQIISKPHDGSNLQVPQIKADMLMMQELNVLDFMHCVGKQNYENNWKKAHAKYSKYDVLRGDKDKFSEIHLLDLKDVLQTFYQCSIIQAKGSRNVSQISSYYTTTAVPHPNISPAICIIECPNAFYILQPYQEHTLHDGVTFSPAMLTQSYAKPLFVVYQLLQVVQYCHRIGIPCGDVSLKDFAVNEKLWVSMRSPRWETLFKCAKKSKSSDSKATKCNKIEQSDDKILLSGEKIIDDGNEKQENGFHQQWDLESLPELVLEWVSGKLSNYDYLLILNHLAGRRIGNPNYHPIVPWVMDFTRPDGGYRDLTKSKYRLNKGDRQLDLTYEAALNMAASSLSSAIDSPAHIPHHVSDVHSSGISYFIYKARQFPRSVLCSHVRPKWVPGEYPSSMQRLQEWTPDECIPEFFSDPDIFVSRHTDMADLELPSWCNGREDFIKKHRAVLESDYVSERLHRWIDITFGYKLSGTAAIKAKNVCLHLADQHTHPTTHGIVQLFNVPHPKRLAKANYMGAVPPVIKSKPSKPDVTVNNKSVEPEKDESQSQETSIISSGLVASLEGIMGGELNDVSTGVTQGVEADVINTTAQEGQETASNIEESLESQVSEISVEGSSSNGKIVSASTETPNATLTASITTDDTQPTKNPIKKFPFFRSREVVDTKPSVPRPEHQTIILPEDFDPLALLNQLESVYTFSSKACHGLPSVEEKGAPYDISQECVSSDMRALGCIVAELFLAPKLRMQNPQVSLDDRYHVLQKMMLMDNVDLPRSVKRIVRLLVKQDNGKTPGDKTTKSEDTWPLMTPSLLLQPFADIIPFPKYFSTLYQFLSELHVASSSPDKVYNDVLISRRQAMEKVQIATKWIPQILRSIQSEGKSVLLPYVLELLSSSDTALHASLLILNKIMQYYGPKASKKHFLQPLIKIYDSDFTSTNAVLLFHRSFVSQLMVRFGLKVFVRSLLEFIVNATTGVKYCPRFDDAEDDQIGVMPETGRTRFLSEAQDAFDFFGSKGGSFPERSFMPEKMAGNGRSDSPRLEFTGVSDDEDEVIGDDSDSSSRKEQSTSGDSSSVDALSLSEERRNSQTEETSPIKSDLGEATGDITQDLIVKSEDAKSNATNDQMEDSSLSVQSSPAATSSPRTGKVPEGTTINDRSHQDTTEEDNSPLPAAKVQFARVPQELDGLPYSARKEIMTVSSLLDLPPGSTMVNAAVETTLWLAHRLGPALTATYLSGRLLRALAQCYLGREQLSTCDDGSDSESSDDEYGVSIERKTVQGDLNAKAVLSCLMDIALLYGDQFLFQQYFPFIHETVKVVKKVNSKTESSLVACVVLLKHVLPYLKDTQLMDNLKMVFRKIVQPLIHIISSNDLTFPTGGLARSVIAFKLVDIITTIALRIGRDMTREHMTGLLQHFFVCFEQVHGENGPTGLLSSPEYDRNTSCYSTDSEEMYCEIKVDTSSNQYKVGTPTKLEYLKGEFGEDLARSPIATNLAPRLAGENLDHIEDGRWCDPSILRELQEAFTPELAHTAYIPLCRLTGSIHMESKLYNHEMIWRLSSTHEKELADQAAAEVALAQQAASANPNDPSLRQTSWFVDIGASVPAVKLEDDDPLHVVSGEFGRNVALVGNRIDISSGFGDSDSSDDDEKDGGTLTRQRLTGSSGKSPSEKKVNLSSEMGKSVRQLEGTWLNYWEQFTAKGELDDVFQFTQLKLQSFVGHTAAVRALCPMGNENSFVSASKDKMVKLWSLRNQGDGSHKSQCRFTYPYHRKTVFAAIFLEAPRLVATCDGVVHVWDPFTGAVVRQYDLTRGSPSLLVKLPAPSPMLIAAMADATVRFIDTRQHSVQHEFKVAAGPLGLVRCMAVSPDGNTLGVGLSSGVLSMVDIRTGLLLGGWRAHEGEVLQMKSCSNNTFITTSVDHSITMWKEDGSRICSFRGANEPVHCLQISNGQMVSATTANRIGIHSSLDQHAGYYSTRLRNDVLRGVISAMEVLPLNKQLLLGSDNGSITLLA